MTRCALLLILLLSLPVGAEPKLESPTLVRLWVSTRPASDVYLVPVRSGPAVWLGRSEQTLTLDLPPGTSECILLLQCPGYQPTTLRLKRAEATDGARLGPYTLEPAAGQWLMRLLLENRWLLGGWFVTALLYFSRKRALQRLARSAPPGAPSSIGPVLYSNHPVHPPDLPLGRPLDGGFVLGCGGSAGVLLGAILWAGSQGAAHLLGTLPLSPDWIWKTAAWCCLATALLELLFNHPLELAQYVGERGLARFRFSFRLQSELVLYEEVARVEEVVHPQERDMGHHEVDYVWMTSDGQERLRLHDQQGARGFAAVALAAWRQARRVETDAVVEPETSPDG